MGSNSNLQTWVSDKLISLLGYSQATVVQYVIGLGEFLLPLFISCSYLLLHLCVHMHLFMKRKHIMSDTRNDSIIAAKRATSPADILGELENLGLSSSSDTRAFAEEIFSRVPHRTAGVNVSS